MQTFIDHLSKYRPLTEQEIQLIYDNLSTAQFRKGDFLLREGEISSSFYFNLQGCIRLFYNVDGEEKTAFFYTEGSFISSYESFVQQKPARHALQAIEDSEVVVLSWEASNRLLSAAPTFDFLARMIMEEELALYQNLLASYVTQKPEQRYLSFVKENADLIQRIPQYYIATYLGVNAETLSRIRKRIAAKGLN